MRIIRFTKAYFYGDSKDIDRLEDFLDIAEEYWYSDPFFEMPDFHHWFGFLMLMLGYKDGPYIYDEEDESIEPNFAKEKPFFPRSFRGNVQEWDRRKVTSSETSEELIYLHILNTAMFPDYELQTIADHFNLKFEFLKVDNGVNMYYRYGNKYIYKNNFFVETKEGYFEYVSDKEVVCSLLHYISDIPVLAPYVSSVKRLIGHSVDSKEFKELIDIVDNYREIYDKDVLFEVHEIAGYL